MKATARKTRRSIEPSYNDSELRYRRLFEASQEGILLLEARTGVIVDVNPSLLAMLGHGRDELMDKKLWEVDAFHDIRAAKDAFDVLQEDEYILYEDLTLKAKDGHLVPAEFIGSIYSVGGEKVIQCSFRQTTTRKRAEKARRVGDRQMQALMASLDDLIIEMDGQGTYLNIWTGNESLLAKPRVEMLGRGAAEILGAELSDKVLESCRRVLARGDYEDIEYALDVIGGHRWFLARINPVPAEDGNAETVCMLVRDITERKRTEEALLKSEALLREQSVRDHLTGLFNRRYMEETLERELLRASRRHLSVGVMMLDVDGFKQFNDTRGHAAGDAVLRELGKLLLRHVRGEDIPSRYGGDEFIVVLPDVTKEMTRERAELLCEDAGHINIQFEGQTLEALTLSVGVAAFPEDGSSSAAVLKAADAALYRAKEEGQGGVAVAE